MNIVVTGSSTGIGRALTERLLARGDHVWGIARSDQSALAARFPDGFFSSRADVAEWPQMEAAAKTVAKTWTHVDGVVTCAGIQGEIGRTLTADPANWSRTVRANLDGTFNAIRAFAPLFAKAPRRAKVVCFSGGGATKARSRFSAYAAAKTAVVRLVENIAEEEHGAALDINAVAPGAINTRLTEEVLALGPDVVGSGEFAAAQKQKATGGASMDKAVGLVEWLLSPASDGISGRLLSAPWDPWPTLERHATELASSDIFTLRRIVPEDRGRKW
jgi:3-oxoacyl-[acyl-carrier protein] reductase